MKDQQEREVQFMIKKSTPLRKLTDAELRTRCCPKAFQSQSGWSSTTLTSLNSEAGDAVSSQSKVFEAILQPDDETVKKVNRIQLDDGHGWRDLDESDLDQVVGEGHGTASQEVRVAKIAKPAAEHSKAVKADVAEQLKAEKSMTERTAEDAVVEASQIKRVAVERSLRMPTPQLRRSLWSQRRRSLSQRRQR